MLTLVLLAVFLVLLFTFPPAAIAALVLFVVFKVLSIPLPLPGKLGGIGIGHWLLSGVLLLVLAGGFLSRNAPASDPRQAPASDSIPSPTARGSWRDRIREREEAKRVVPVALEEAKPQLDEECEQAGTFHVEGEESPRTLCSVKTPVHRTRKTAPSNEGTSRRPFSDYTIPGKGDVEVVDFSERIVSTEYGYQTRAWVVEVRAAGRSSCYVEFRWLDGDGFQLQMSNENVPIPRGSNGFVVVRGSSSISLDIARQIEQINPHVQCH